MSAREREIVANGLRHHVIEWGRPTGAPPVVLCHGFLDIAWSFVDVAERLVEAGHQVFAFDWRGHGETDWIGEGGYYHFPDYLLDLHALLPQLTTRPCHLVGHSMGGTACTLFAATHTEALSSLALLEGLGPPVSPGAPYPERLTRWMQAVEGVAATPPKPMASVDEALARMRRRTPDVPGALGRLLADKGTAPAEGGEGRVWRWDPLHRTPSPFGFDLARFRECVEAIAVPTLCVVGSRGMRTGDDDERYALLRDGRRVELTDCGHMMHWTHPEPLADALSAFWRQLGPA